jgi:hypothetical protein
LWRCRGSPRRRSTRRGAAAARHPVGRLLFRHWAADRPDGEAARSLLAVALHAPGYRTPQRPQYNLASPPLLEVAGVSESFNSARSRDPRGGTTVTRSTSGHQHRRLLPPCGRCQQRLSLASQHRRGLTRSGGDVGRSRVLARRDQPCRVPRVHGCLPAVGVFDHYSILWPAQFLPRSTHGAHNRPRWTVRAIRGDRWKRQNRRLTGVLTCGGGVRRQGLEPRTR